MKILFLGDIVGISGRSMILNNLLTKINDEKSEIHKNKAYEIINETNNIHRLPLILDSIFKEDLEAKSKEMILEFICKNQPDDTQTIISVADNKSKEPKLNIIETNFSITILN